MFLLSLGKAIAELSHRALGQRAVMSHSLIVNARVEYPLAHVLCIVLHSDQWIFLNHIMRLLLALVILSNPLPEFLAQYSLECGIQLRGLIDPLNVSPQWRLAPEPVKALILHIPILHIATHICGGHTLFDLLWESLPALGIGSLRKVLMVEVIWLNVECVGRVTHLALVPERVGVARVRVRAIVHVEIQLLLVAVVAVHARKGHDVLGRRGAEGTHGLVGEEVG
ncbi:hypothetical protein FGO68_gene3831 [Halteria grandinella]|uniref:Uncharacterized protein n=1 Tax=Halteria grandinella TaxID=5974 RepID=A0A8J8NCF7_HALGN|nr:hypothetical protein FGO68_gene3831 [Halteria grandinella]